ncbi:MAG: hypothetical protein P8N61_02445 [Porticoccaceae bacterium]|jgi:hypothetical protein|nr:hypothetical protein [Porticoccaceae bacterium]
MRFLIILLLVLPTMVMGQQAESDRGQNIETAGAEERPLETPAGAPEETAEQSAPPEDSDFKPTEEISEDFPVPLPSDI